VLTGSLDDGTAGLQSIKRRGGVAIVQSPEDALYPSMPQSAVENVDVDHVVPLAEIASLLERLAAEKRPDVATSKEEIGRMDLEKKIAQMDAAANAQDDRPGEPSAFSCPDCGGVLWEINDGEYGRFRCRVGHAYSPESMLGAQADRLEEALWSAMKTLEETARMTARLAEAERSRGHQWMADKFAARERHARKRAELIRDVLSKEEPVPIETPQQEQSDGN